MQDCEYKTAATLPTYEMVAMATLGYSHKQFLSRLGVAQLEVKRQTNYHAHRLEREQASQTGCTFSPGGTDTRGLPVWKKEQTIDQLLACARDELAGSVYDSGMQRT